MSFAAVLLRACLFIGWLAFCFPAAAAENYSLHWVTNSNPCVVEVTGLEGPVLKTLAQYQSADWQKLLSVYAVQADLIADMRVPAMMGSYRFENGVIRFQPQFPLERGVTYRAVFRSSRLPGVTNSAADMVARYQLPLAQQEPTTIVSRIYPSADVLPENLLKFYIHFSAPMQGGHIYDHIHLRDQSGKAVELPFLEIDEELWSPDMTRLTLFIDPGRIKRGVRPLEEIGPALEAGKHYSLEIDSAWRDHAGLPLRENFKKSFQVGPPDREPLRPTMWKIVSPGAGTREMVSVDFTKPLDAALALRVINIVGPTGKLVEGETTFGDHEQRWLFMPRAPWRAGRHQLQVQNTIEDLAGNNIGKAFEVDLFEGVQRRFTNTVVKLEFKVR